MSHGAVGKGITSRGHHKCKGPGVGVCLACSRDCWGWWVWPEQVEKGRIGDGVRGHQEVGTDHTGPFMVRILALLGSGSPGEF